MSDFYKTLGINKNASEDEIKKAYKKLAKKWHPDRFTQASDEEKKTAESKMKDINAAYDVLKDPQKRRQYDMFGDENPTGRRGNQGGWHTYRTGGNNPFGFDFGDIFNDLFGQDNPYTDQQQRPDYPERGADIQQTVFITLEEAFTGKDTELDYYNTKTCKHCHGLGAEKESDIETCPMCHGTGTIQEVKHVGPMRMVNSKPCHKCYGKGTINKNPCKHCHGIGTTSEKETISFVIPKGIQNGMRVRVKGKGSAGKNGGSPGDLFVFVNIQPHETFKCEDANLYADRHITMVQAALGRKINVKTIDGEIELMIPPGTASGTIQKIAGKGMPRLRGEGRGDLFIRLIIDTPKNLTDRQKELLEEFTKEEENKEPKYNFINKTKNFLKNMFNFQKQSDTEVAM